MIRSAGVFASAGLASALWLAGCGTPGAPQPPSLKLPELVSDLTVERAGNSVTLHWTMPKKTTDHLLLKDPIPVQICWRERSGNCQPAGQVTLGPESEGEFQGILPTALLTGEARPVSYFVELKSPKGRSAGLSNPAIVLAGAAPGPVAGFSAQVRADGVALHWTGSEATAVRLHRKLLTPATPQAKPGSGLMKASPEPVLRDLLVEAPAPGQETGALDSTARFGEVYEYTAQRVERVAVDGPIDGPVHRHGDSHSEKRPLELAGEISAPVRVEMIDTFPPAVPQGLVAVLVPEEKTIDLSWQPNTDNDLAGYIVYRADADGSGDWKRISAPQPLTGSAFRDSAIEPGHSYRYAVSAIDLTGHESKRSAEARESVPNP
jgi:hypothetical protein